jgi:hypothetical protein
LAVLTVPVGVGGGTWLCGAVKFRELGGRCCNLGAQEKGERDNQWKRGGGQLKRLPLLGIGCFYRCPPIVRASLPGLLVDRVAWVPLVNKNHLRHKQLASAAQEPAIRFRCDAASNARVLDGYTKCIISHLIEAFSISVVEARLSASKGYGWDRKANDNSTGCNLKSSFSPGRLQWLREPNNSAHCGKRRTFQTRHNLREAVAVAQCFVHSSEICCISMLPGPPPCGTDCLGRSSTPRGGHWNGYFAR